MTRRISGKHFNPRLPRGRRLAHVTSNFRKAFISIHASLAGGDFSASTIICYLYIFQSTPPSREATPASALWPFSRSISIHASLAGGDGDQRRKQRDDRLFQSTPPSREATRRPSRRE